MGEYEKRMRCEKRENMRNSCVENSEIEYVSRYENIWIIGGSQIYDSFMTENNNKTSNLLIDEFYITYIDKEYKCDTFFPLIENMNLYYINFFSICKCEDGTGEEVDVYFIVFKRIVPYKNCESNNNSNNNDNTLFKKVYVDSSDIDKSDNFIYCNIEKSIYDKRVIENKHLKILESFFDNTKKYV